MSGVRIPGSRFEMIDTTLERKISEMVPPTPPTRIVDTRPRTGPWSGNNQLGYELPFAPDDDNRQTILKLDEWGMPEMWTVSLGMRGFPQGLFDGFGVRANINFGVGGSTQTIEVDWRNGAQVSLVMNAVNVIASFQNLDIDTEGQGLFLSVQMSRGNRPGKNGPLATLLSFGPSGVFPSNPFAKGTPMSSVTIPNATSTGLMVIPPFASRIVAVSAGGIPADIANFYNANNFFNLVSGNNAALRPVNSLRGSDLLSKGGLDVFSEARFATFFNASGGDIEASFYAELAA